MILMLILKLKKRRRAQLTHSQSISARELWLTRTSICLNSRVQNYVFNCRKKTDNHQLSWLASSTPNLLPYLLLIFSLFSRRYCVIMMAVSARIIPGYLSVPIRIANSALKKQVRLAAKNRLFSLISSLKHNLIHDSVRAFFLNVDRLRFFNSGQFSRPCLSKNSYFV